MTQVSIRPVRSEDRAQWLPLWHAYLTFYRQVPDDAVTDSTWARVLDPAEPVHAHVAEQGGRLVGLAHSLFHRNTWSIAPICYLQDLYADPDVRGRGVGRALIEAVSDHAASTGSTTLYWLTHETNATAMRLYDQVAGRTGFLHYRKTLSGRAGG